jgi:hypothetical protein
VDLPSPNEDADVAIVLDRTVEGFRDRSFFLLRDAAGGVLLKAYAESAAYEDDARAGLVLAEVLMCTVPFCAGMGGGSSGFGEEDELF